MLNIVFMGTPELATSCLEACVENHNVMAVFTQPDKPSGRGKKLTPPPVKISAEKSGIKVYQPDKIRTSEDLEVLKSLNPDLIVVVAYGQILSSEILNIPKFGCINVHTSLLPKLRGAAPINWAILNGDKEGGVTIMQMDEGLDTGDMLYKMTCPIESLTAGEYYNQLMKISPDALLKTIDLMEKGELEPEKQDHDAFTYAPKLNREMAKIDWHKTSEEIDCFVRGMNPWPVAHTSFDDQKIKVFKGTIIQDKSSDLEIGAVISVDKMGINVKTLDGVFRIEELQYGNKKRMLVSAFIAGNKSIKEGSIFK